MCVNCAFCGRGGGCCALCMFGARREDGRSLEVRNGREEGQCLVKE